MKNVVKAMDPQQIKGFLAVLKTGSFSKAATETHRLQPAISRQIKALEEDLGARLFERFGPLSVKPTREALILRDIVSPLIQDFESVKIRFDEQRGSPTGTELRIAANEATITYLLPDIIADLKHNHPKLAISLIRRSKDDILSAVLEGEVDFGIASLEKPPLGTVYQTFATYSRVAVVPKNHPLLKKQGISLEDLSKYPLILPAIGSRTRKVIDNAFMKAGVPYNLFLEVMGRDSAKTYVSKGLGISIMSESYLTGEDKKKLVAIDLSKYFGRSSRGVLHRKGKFLSAVHDEFVRKLIPSARH